MWRPAVLLGVCAATVAVAQRVPVAIEHVRVFDGQTTVEDATVVIANGLIAAVGPAVEVPSGAVRVDGRGKTLLPGLIDAHVHIHGARSRSKRL
jgi:imidazolonepropionase-like amidohydrolase